MKVRKLLWLDVKVQPVNIQTATPEALRINGYTTEAWGDSVSVKEAATKLRSMAADAILAGWNVAFDSRFVGAMVRGLGLEPTWDYHTVDVFSLAWPRLVVGNDGLKMTTACRLLGVPEEPRPHRAINGARTALALYRRILESA
jgi:DNA polymerase III epsilon subunit-like protein